MSAERMEKASQSTRAEKLSRKISYRMAQETLSREEGLKRLSRLSPYLELDINRYVRWSNRVDAERRREKTRETINAFVRRFRRIQESPSESEL